MAEGAKAASESGGKDGAKPDLAAEIAALRKEMAVVAEMIGTIARDGWKGLSEAALKDGEARLGESAEMLRARVGQLGDELAGADAKLRKELDENPWRTLGLAALGGFVLALVLRR